MAKASQLSIFSICTNFCRLPQLWVLLTECLCPLRAHVGNALAHTPCCFCIFGEFSCCLDKRGGLAAAQYLDEDAHTLLHIFFQTERRLWYY